ncbi:protein translocase subunit SecD [Alkalihalobacillus trypoxylicola]|uniref:protein translocase subunit SecD n=1 Tax=Alkalihalobacillus trypoxylicola TaxID=519424 RepID=UPI0004320E91|nr:protein translocase subunit SecD [Alkalihalobacillus trypoxylicola]GAF65897.1 preprotein translocase subunit SecD [Bacillus sp. TS-2]
MAKKGPFKKGPIATFFLIIILLAAVISQTVMGVAKDISLGLDLQGGFEILYEVTPAVDGDVIDQNALTATVSALNQRVNVLGVSEPNIQIEGEDRIRVQLAGVEDQHTAREMLSTEAQLTFRDVNDEILLDGTDLQQNGASTGFDPNTGNPMVTLTLKDAARFAEVTNDIRLRPPGENLLVIWLDFEEGVDSYQEEVMKEEPKFLSAASVDRVIDSRDVQITGPNFTVEETNFISEILNAGSLPVQLEEIYSNSVGASLGEQAMEKTIYAGFIGVALIFLYMIIYYRFMGVMAVVTLSAYIYLVLLVFNLMNAVLTLPGIAALILGVGMAVDANILTYERIKEELRVGKSVMSAFKAGSKRALTTIMDANITSLLAAGVMFVYGTSSVQGFAVMLIVGILVSFVTAVYGARLLLGLWINSRILNKKYWLFGVKEDEIDEL